VDRRTGIFSGGFAIFLGVDLVVRLFPREAFVVGVGPNKPNDANLASFRAILRFLRAS